MSIQNFFRPTLLKIIATIILTLVFFGERFFYGMSRTVLDGKVIEPNIVIRGVDSVIALLFYPVYGVANFIEFIFGKQLYSSTVYSLIFGIILLSLIVIENYIICCAYSILVNKKKQ